MFCLGVIIGMTFAFAVNHIVERKRKRKDNEKI